MNQSQHSPADYAALRGEIAALGDGLNGSADASHGSRLGALQQRALEVRNALVLANRGLVGQFVSRSGIHPNDREELESRGYLALMRALEEYQPERGAFSTCFGWWFRAAYSALVKERRRGGMPTDWTDGDIEQPVDTRGTEEAANRRQVAFADTWERLQTAGVLSPREADVLRLRFGVGGLEPHGFPDIAGRVPGVKSKQLAKQIVDKARKKLREYAEEQGIPWPEDNLVN